MRSKRIFRSPNQPPVDWELSSARFDGGKPMWIPHHGSSAWYRLRGPSLDPDDMDDARRRQWIVMPRLPADDLRLAIDIDRHWKYRWRVQALEVLTIRDWNEPHETWPATAKRLEVTRRAETGKRVKISTSTFRSRLAKAQERLHDLGVLPWYAWDKGRVPEAWWREDAFLAKMDEWCDYAATRPRPKLDSFGFASPEKITEAIAILQEEGNKGTTD